jgi:type IV pilus biogenesis protein CpaD/CtpE
MNEFEVREMAGVHGTGNGGSATDQRWVELYEGEHSITVTIGNYQTGLTVEEAKKLARQLSRLARRIENRILGE